MAGERRGRIVAVTIVLLAGCESLPDGHVALPPQTADKSYHYTTITVRAQLSHGGAGGVRNDGVVPIRYKLFPHQDRLAICGFYLYGAPYHCEGLLYRRWFNEATFSVNGRVIGSGWFFERNSPGSDSFNAGCVATSEPWNESYLSTPRLTAVAPASQFSFRCLQ